MVVKIDEAIIGYPYHEYLKIVFCFADIIVNDAVIIALKSAWRINKTHACPVSFCILLFN